MTKFAKEQPRNNAFTVFVVIFGLCDTFKWLNFSNLSDQSSTLYWNRSEVKSHADMSNLLKLGSSLISSIIVSGLC